MFSNNFSTSHRMFFPPCLRTNKPYLKQEITNALGIEKNTQQKAKEVEIYKVPERRALGRPHETGWLDWLEEEAVNKKDIYESDNWREALQRMD